MIALSLCVCRYSSSHIDSLVRADDVAALGLVYERLRKRFRTHRFSLEDSIRTICKKAHVAWTRALAKTLEGLEGLAKAEKDGSEKEDGLAGADKAGLENAQNEGLGLAEKEHLEKAREEGLVRTELAGLVEQWKEDLERPQEGGLREADTERVEGRQKEGSGKAEEGAVETTAEKVFEGTRKEGLEKESETEELVRLDGPGLGKVQEECLEIATETGLGTLNFGSEKAKTGALEGLDTEESAKAEGQGLFGTPEDVLVGAQGLDMEQGLRDAEPEKGVKKLEASQGLVGTQEGGSGAAPERQVEDVEKSHVALREAETEKGEKRKRRAEGEANTEALSKADPGLERGNWERTSTPGPLPSTADEGTSSRVAKKSRLGEPGVDEGGGDMETRESAKDGGDELGEPTAQAPPGGGPVAGDDVSSPLQLLRVTSAGRGGREESPAAGTRRSRRSVEGGVETPGRTAPPPRTLAPRCNSRKQSELGDGGKAQGRKPSPEKEAPKEQAIRAQSPSAREKESEFKAQATAVLRSALAMYRDSVSGLAPVLRAQSLEGKVKSEPDAEGGLPGAGGTEGRGEAERMLLRAFTLVHGREAAGVEEVLRLHEDVVKVSSFNAFSRYSV
jgi:hypothetical protein